MLIKSAQTQKACYHTPESHSKSVREKTIYEQRKSIHKETIIRQSSAKLSTYVHGLREWILMKTVVCEELCVSSLPWAPRLLCLCTSL